MKTPFFGPGYVSRSSNVADSVRINLYPELVQTRNGKAVGSYYMAPGKDLLKAVGLGPIYGLHVWGDTLYVVSGIFVYAIDTAMNVTELGTMPVESPVTMIDNGSQLIIFGNGYAFYVGNSYSVLTATPGATPLGSAAPSGFAPGDTIVLNQGTASLPAQLVVATTEVATAALVYPGSGGSNLCGVLSCSVVAGGTGGTNGAVTIVGTTGTGIKFQATGQITGGVLSGALTVSNTGLYSTNPTSLTAEPVVGGGLTGATVALTLEALPQIVTGTTGTGAKFSAQVLIAIGGGPITSVVGISQGGAYTANPTDINNEPVAGASLTGALLSVQMAPASAAVATNGTYSVQPTNPVAQSSSSGNGTGSVWTLTWVTSANTLSQVQLPFSNPGIASYQDGFVLVLEQGTDTWWQSGLFDVTTWDPLNFASAEGLPTNIIAVAEIHREQWLFKSNCIEVWINAGLNGFAFQRLEGVFIETGIAAAFSVSKCGEFLVWLTKSDEGQGQIAMANGYQPQIVSTHSMEREIASYPIISDAVSYSYQQEGHLFYVINFPSGNATWVYDVSASAEAGVPMWHRRAAFSNGQFSRDQGNNHALFRGQHLVGDYQTGNIYALNLDSQLDNGQQRKWVMTWRAMPASTMQPVRFSSLQIDMQTGIGVPAGTNPQLMLRWSDDGGHSWSNSIQGSAGKTGETKRRVKFTRLGATRRNAGLDRVFELSSADPFAVALIGAELM